MCTVYVIRKKKRIKEESYRERERKERQGREREGGGREGKRERAYKCDIPSAPVDAAMTLVNPSILLSSANLFNVYRK